VLIMAGLRSRIIYVDIIFLSCGFFFFLLLLSIFFRRLIAAVADWTSTILRHMMWS